MPRLSICFIFFLAAAASLIAQTPIKVGKATYFDNTTTQSKLQFPGNPYITDDFSQKVISNKWWASLISQPYSYPIHPHPASYKAVAAGLEMAYLGSASVKGNGEFTTYAPDIEIDANGMNSADTRVASYSHWGVKARWKQGTKLMEAMLCNGSPFAYFKISGAGAVINCKATPTIWYNQGGVIGMTVNGKNFGVFAPTGSSWSGTTSLTSSLGGKDYLSVAILPDNTPATLSFFQQYAYSFITDTKVSWQYVEKTAQLVSTFTVATEAKEGTQTGTLFGLFRHQWLNIMPGTAFAPYTYKSARGDMKVVAGSSFQTVNIFNGLLMTMPDTGYDKNTLANYVKNENVPGGTFGGNTYNGQFEKYASLAQIANMVGNTAKRDEAVAVLKRSLETWFTANLSNEYFYYCKPWNRLVGCPAGYGSDNRFSDHHFHYGYFLSGASTVAQFDPQWALPENWGGMVEMLIRDVNSPYDNDPLFGRFCCFEPYEGHGYADGLGGEADNAPYGNNQESSSESMNFNRSLIHWGVMTKNKVLRDLGIFMYVQETNAIEQYWWDVDNVNFPPEYPKLCVGMVWSAGGVYGTWFSGDPAAIHAINLLCISAGSTYIGRRPDYIVKFDAEGYNGNWDDQFNEMLVFADPVKAMQRSNNGTRAGNMYGTNTNAYYYHHMNSVNASGRLALNVTADVPTYAVFQKDQIRTYTAYNPDDAASIVSFSDGFKMQVPAKTQVTKGGIKVAVRQPLVITGSKRDARMEPVTVINHSFQGTLATGKETLELFDLSGKKIYTGSATAVAVSIPNGMYFMRRTPSR
jgi:endoglucanase Acf2